jgi:hypothetical protein
MKAASIGMASCRKARRPEKVANEALYRIGCTAIANNVPTYARAVAKFGEQGVGDAQWLVRWSR